MALDIAISRTPNPIVSGSTKISVGASLGSANPTMASVNADYSHFNQAVALYNRRTNQVMTTPSVMTYFSGGLIPSSQISTLRTKINALRACLGYGAATYTNSTISAGMKIKKIDLDELFSALGFSGQFGLSGIASRRMLRVDRPYGTVFTAPVSGPTGNTGDFYGKRANALSVQRARLGQSFSVPLLPGAKSPSTLTLSLATGSWLNTLESWSPQCWASNTDDSSYSGAWYLNLNALVGNFSYGAPSSIAFPSTFFNSKRGLNFSLIMGEDSELADTGVGAGAVKDAAVFNPTGMSIGFDWGF